MKLLLAAMLASAALLADAPESLSRSTELNVNSRYTVESVDLSPRQDYHLSDPVVNEMQRLVGEHLNPEALSRLSRRMMSELRARNVTFRVVRGLEPAHVRVVFDIEKQETTFDVSLSRLMYDSREGWSGNGQLTITSGPNVLTAAGISNGDDLVERYSGIRARFDRFNVGSSRVRLGFEFDEFREQYSAATPAALLASGSSLGAGVYRSRMNLEPSATFVFAQPLTLTVGMSFERLQPQSGVGKADSADAWFTTLRYDRQGELAGGVEELEAIYRLRTASRLLGSGSLYTRHSANARYSYKHNRHTAEVAVMAGFIYGQAPLFERFVLGNSTTLRGWNKYDLDPLGGNRVVHASVTYGYQILRVFYDTGAVWDTAKGQGPDEKHSVGAGVTTGLGMFNKDALLLAVAFPVRQGRVWPVFIAGMNF